MLQVHTFIYFFLSSPLIGHGSLYQRFVSDDFGKSIAIAKQLSTRSRVTGLQPIAVEHPGIEAKDFKPRNAETPQPEAGEGEIPGIQSPMPRIGDLVPV